MITVAKITKKELREVQYIRCMECAEDATRAVSAGGGEIDGVVIDLCEMHFRVLQKKIARVK